MSRLAQASGIEHTHSSQGRLAGFVSWWLRELAALTVGKAKDASQYRALVRTNSDGIEIYARESGELHLKGGFSSADVQQRIPQLKQQLRSWGIDARNTLLRLSEDQVLEHTLRIPNRARDVIDPIVRNQMERILPWPRSRTCIGYEVEETNCLPDHVSVRVIATSAEAIEKACRAANNIGMNVRCIDFAEDVNKRDGIILLTRNDEAQDRRAKRIGWFVTFLILVSLVSGAAGVLRLIPLKTELKQIEQNLDVARARVSRARVANEKTSLLIGQRRWIAEKRDDGPAMLSVLNALTKALPDSAYLTSIEFEDGRIQLAGQSSDAASLVGKLEAVQQFSDVRFSAPTLRHRDKPTESFAITLKLIARAHQGALR
jgi:general secretion pathway protein L